MRFYPFNSIGFCLLAIGSFGVLVAGCGLAAPYRCATPVERKAYNAAVRDIYPDDVRRGSTEWAGRIVAWVGVISRSEVREQGEDIEVELAVRHHYFDWIENFRLLGDNTFTLSPRGEGHFRTRWYFRKGAEPGYYERVSAVGNMVVAYGKPAGINEDGSIELEAAWVRFIPSWRVRFCEHPYGRGAGLQY